MERSRSGDVDGFDAMGCRRVGDVDELLTCGTCGLSKLVELMELQMGIQTVVSFERLKKPPHASHHDSCMGASIKR